MPSDVESPMYATELHEVVFRAAASPDFDVCAPFPAAFASGGALFRVESFRLSSSGAEVFDGGSTVLCEDTPWSAGAFWEVAERPLLSGVLGPIMPARPAPSRARTPTATSATTPPTNRRRRWSRVEALRRHSPDLICFQSFPMAPRRIGSSKKRQE